MLRVEKASLQGTIDGLGEKLNACFQAGAGREWTDAELDAIAPCPTSAPCKPWERAWWPYDPAPPPGFVIEQRANLATCWRMNNPAEGPACLKAR